jgi:hypothetical protein
LLPNRREVKDESQKRRFAFDEIPQLSRPLTRVHQLIRKVLKHLLPQRRIHNSQFIIRHSSSILYLLTLFCALCLGCGIQGPPRPPRVEKPEKISDLAVIQKGRILELTFTLPLLATDGERLTKPLEIEIFRAITKPGGTPSEPDAGSAPWQTFSSADLQKLIVGGKIVFSTNFSDQEFNQTLGSTYTFAVRGLTRGFRGRRLEGDYSNIARHALLDVSPPVENLHIETTENALVLSWMPPSRGLSGQALAALSGYRVYLSLTGKPGSFQLRGETPAPTFSDPDFAFGHDYFFSVRALFKQDVDTAESEDCAPVLITPRDTFPPAPPSNLSALFSAGAVQLVWTASSEADLGGYNVYRHEKDGAPQKINSELLRTPTFEDRTIQPGHQYFYRATAVDLTGNESSPSEEAMAETP